MWTSPSVKTVSFALVHFTVAFSVVYALTGNIALGGLVGLVEPLCNTVAYYFHERIWEGVRRRRIERARGSGEPLLAA